MKSIKFICLGLLISSIALLGADYKKAFPVADSGMKRLLLELPHKENEQNYMLELIVGKNIDVDSANKYFYSGKIKTEDIKGWGFTRYVVPTLGQLAGTRIFSQNSKKIKKFVSLGCQAYLIAYNSKVPIALYIPQDAQAYYRIWSADNKINEFK